MYNFIIAVMDRNSWKARTDIIILVILQKKKLLWIPRDLYIDDLKNRINTAYSKGGKNLLIKCLQKKLNIIIKNCICVLPKAIEEIFSKIGSIIVPVNFDRSFYYPLHRHEDIENGRKIISFYMPSEKLEGERFHEWIGARYALNPVGPFGSDLDRIYRQQILVKECIKNKINRMDFNITKNYIKDLDENIINFIKIIDESWKISCLNNIISKKINNMEVFDLKS